MATYNGVSYSSSGAASSLTYSHTTGGSDRSLVVSVMLWSGSVTCTGVTYNGVAMTSLTSAVVGSGFTAYLFGLSNPTTGANNVIVSLSGSAQFASGAISATAASQAAGAAAFGTVASVTAGSGTPSVVVTSATNELVVDVVGSTSGVTVGAGQTGRWFEGFLSNMDVHGSTEPGASSVTMSWVNSAVHALLAVPIKDVGPPPNIGTVTIGAPSIAASGTVLNPPTIVGAGTAAYTATNAATIAPGLPAGWAANDIHILFAHRSDNTAMTTLSGWNPLSAANNTAAQRVEVWWRRAVGGDAAPTVTFGSGTVVRGARIIGIRGCPTNVDPFAVALSRSDNAASATVTFATITPNEAATLLLALYAYEDDPTAASQITNWSTFTVSTSSLGNDASLGYASRVWPTANSATGALTSTISGGTFTNSPSVGVILALKPMVPAITGTGSITLDSPSLMAVTRGDGTFALRKTSGVGSHLRAGDAMRGASLSSDVSGTGSIAIGAPVLAGTGTFAGFFTGTGAVTIGAPTLSGTGTFAGFFTGTGAVAIGAPVLAASGTFATTGTGALSVGIPVLAGLGTFATTGTGALTIGAPTLSGMGTVVNPITGTGAISLLAPVLAGTGAFSTTGTGAVALSPPVVAGSGVAFDGPVSGTGAISLLTPVLAASGAFIGVGTGALTIDPPVLAGSGTFTTTGSGAVAIGPPVLDGSGSSTSLSEVTVSAATAWHTRMSIELFGLPFANLDTEWHVRAAISKTAASAWNERYVVEVPIFYWPSVNEWHVRQVVSVSLATEWNVASSLTEVLVTTDAEWHTRAAPIQTAVSAWNTRAAVSQTVDSAWSVRTAVTPVTVSTAWYVGATPTQTIGVAWHVLAIVSVDLGSEWGPYRSEQSRVTFEFLPSQDGSSDFVHSSEHRTAEFVQTTRHSKSELIHSRR